MSRKIKIKEIEYAVQPGMKSIIVFEKITDKPFQIKTTTDLLSYIYSSLIVGSPDKHIEFADMLDAFDENPDLFKEATDIVLQRTSLEEVVSLSNEGEPEPKKE